MTTRRTRGWMTSAALAAALLATTAWPATAGEPSKTADRTPTAEPEKGAVPASDATRANAPREESPKPVTLYGNRWYRGVEAAVAAGAQKKKPILLVRMLGELDEKT